MSDVGVVQLVLRCAEDEDKGKVTKLSYNKFMSALINGDLLFYKQFDGPSQYDSDVEGDRQPANKKQRHAISQRELDNLLN